MKYVIYARKSEEAEDRQVASIPAQLNALNKIAQDKQLSVVKVFKEEKTAKKQGRPVFNDMLQFIMSGKADAILCWKINRLSRNPYDSGDIAGMLQDEIIKRVTTPEKDYNPEDNSLLMNIEFGVANEFIRGLRKDTIRGINNKLEMGWMPARARIGYLNDPLSPQGQKRVYKDPETFDKVRYLWDLLLEKQWSVKRIAEEARAMGLKPKGSKRYLQPSSTDRMFHSIFYTGKFEYDGKIYQGQHEPMITMDEYELAQSILSNKSKPRKRIHNFPYTGLIKCGECGAMITAEEKHKTQKNGNYHHYIYYRCTKKKNRPCPLKAIKQGPLEEQITEFIKTLKVSDKFRGYVLNSLKADHNKEAEVQNQSIKSHQKAQIENKKKLDRLLELRLAEEIDQEAYKAKKEQLQNEQTEIEKQLNKDSQRSKNWLELIEKAFDFTGYAIEIFQSDDPAFIEHKKIILRTIGSNLFLKDDKLTIEPEKIFTMIKEPAKFELWGG